MAIQILDEPTALQNVGGALGTGLSSGLQQLAQMKLGELQQRKQQEKMGPIFQALGLPPQSASLDPSIQRELIKQQLTTARQGQQASILQGLGLPGEIGALQQPAQSALIKRLLPQAQEAELEDILGGISQPQQKEQASTQLQQQQNIRLPEESNRELAPTNQAEQASVQQAQQQEELQQAKTADSIKEVNKNIKDFTQSKPLGYELAPMAKGMREIDGLKAAMENPNLNASKRAKIRQEIDKRQSKFEKQQEQVDKQTEKFYSKINDEADTAQSGNIRLDTMEKLVNSGRLAGPTASAILETLEHGAFGMGINLFGSTSTETQEFKKLQTDFLRDVKKVFGSQITNQEVKQYMARIPSLTQSDEGKRKVIEDLRFFNNAALIKKEVMNTIIDENGGFRPHNLDQLVEKRAKPELNTLAKQFKERIGGEKEELERFAAERRSPVSRAIGAIGKTFGF